MQQCLAGFTFRPSFHLPAAYHHNLGHSRACRWSSRVQIQRFGWIWQPLGMTCTNGNRCIHMLWSRFDILCNWLGAFVDADDSSVPAASRAWRVCLWEEQKTRAAAQRHFNTNFQLFYFGWIFHSTSNSFWVNISLNLIFFNILLNFVFF